MFDRVRIGAVPAVAVPPERRRRAGRRCSCGGIVGPGGECAECRRKRLARAADTHRDLAIDGSANTDARVRVTLASDAAGPESRSTHHLGSIAIHPVAASRGGALLQRKPALSVDPSRDPGLLNPRPSEEEECDWPECDDLCEPAARTFFEDEPMSTALHCPFDVAELEDITVDGCAEFEVPRWVCSGEATIDCGPGTEPVTSRFFVRSRGNDQLTVRNEHLLCEYTLLCVDGTWELWPEECKVLMGR